MAARTPHPECRIVGRDVFIDGQKVGWLDESGLIYITPRTKEEHFFWKYHGFALSTVLVEKLRGERVVYVRIECTTERGRLFWFMSLVENWLPLYGRTELFWDPPHDPQHVMFLGKMSLVPGKGTPEQVKTEFGVEMSSLA